MFRVPARTAHDPVECPILSSLGPLCREGGVTTPDNHVRIRPASCCCQCLYSCWDTGMASKERCCPRENKAGMNVSPCLPLLPETLREQPLRHLPRDRWRGNHRTDSRTAKERRPHSICLRPRIIATREMESYELTKCMGNALTPRRVDKA